MENKINLIEPLLERAEEYTKTSLELYKLKIIEKVVLMVSVFISRGAVVLVLCMFIMLLNIATSLWLGELLGKIYYGFFCVAGFYGLIGIILYFFMQNWIKKRASNHLISQILN